MNKILVKFKDTKFSLRFWHVFSRLNGWLVK